MQKALKEQNVPADGRPLRAGLYLASQSPRRREILTQIGVPFDLLSVEVTELQAPAETPQAYVKRLAAEKAQAGCELLAAGDRPAWPVLGADTVVVSDEMVLEKPQDKQQAMAMLQRLSGREHQVLTAVSLCQVDAHSTLRQSTGLSLTGVSFRALSNEEIDAYWETGEPCDKAGAYAIQGLGAVFVESINGSYSGVVGLPIETTVTLLREFNISWWQGRSQTSWQGK